MVSVLSSPGTSASSENPYNRFLLAHMPSDVRVEEFSWARALLGRYDVLHLHWPDGLLRGGSRPGRAAKRTAFALLLVRIWIRRTPAVWTVHNPSPHENVGRVDQVLLHAWSRLSRTRIHLTQYTIPLVKRPGSQDHVIPHGPYEVQGAGSVEAQNPGHSDCQLALFGLLRPYKGIEELIATFAGLEVRAKLTIAGQPWSASFGAKLQDLANSDARVELRLGRMADDELSTLVLGHDGVVLPYRRMINSGAVLYALSHRRPVLVPRTSVNEALAEEVGDQWIAMFDEDLTAETLASFIRSIEGREEWGSPDLSRRSWPTLSGAHAAIYRQLASH